MSNGHPTPMVGPLTVAQYNTAVDLWNAGKTILEIATALGVGSYDLHPMTRAATRVARNMSEDGPIVLAKIQDAF